MNWPLAVDTLTLADRLKIGWWMLRGRVRTQGTAVRAYEELWERYTGAKHAIMVSNGSVANELLARRRKEEIIRKGGGRWPFDNKVVFPVCTWATSVAPWIHEGFVPVWCDISTNLCASSDGIAKLLKMDKVGRIKTVFYTTLLGQSTDLTALQAVCDAHGSKLLLDNCESSMSFDKPATWIGTRDPARHFCSMAPSSTSFYFSHPVTTGTEGGMIFCDDAGEADWYRMVRNHGLTRGMSEQYRNLDVHPAFDFYLLGTNSRSSDLQAYMGSLTFRRSIAYAKQRIALAKAFYAALDKEKYVDVTQGRCDNPLMALPIVPNPTARAGDEHLSKVLDRLGVEHRPIVGGNLLRQTAFKKFGTPSLYPRAQHVHDHAVYIGLHEGVSLKMVLELADELNR